jgi:hypothetical protein
MVAVGVRPFSPRPPVFPRVLGRLGVVCLVAACGMLFALPQAVAAGPTVMNFLPPYGHGSYSNSTSPPTHTQVYGCNSNATAPVAMSFSQGTGRLHFSAVVNGGGIGFSGRGFPCRAGVTGSVLYGLPHMVSTVSGARTVRTYWNLNWTVTLSTVGAPTRHYVRAYAQVGVSITLTLYDLTLNSSAGSTPALFSYGVGHANLSRSSNGPGLLSIPFAATFTKGQTYQLRIEMQVSVTEQSGAGTASYATFSMQAPSAVRLKMVTIR